MNAILPWYTFGRKGYSHVDLMHHDYLIRGFKAMGIGVSYDKRMPEACTGLFAIDFEHNGERRRCQYDWGDFPRMCGDSTSGPYGKIEVLKSDVAGNVFPVPQIAQISLCDTLESVRSQVGQYRSDVYCSMRVTNYDDRLRCIEAIRAIEGIVTLTALAPSNGRALPPAHVRANKVPQKDYFRNIATSRLCVAAPGMGGKTWRHMEIMAIGSCLVMPETDRVWPADYSGCAVVVKPDYSDLDEKVRYYLSHDSERLEIARRGRDYWDKWCSPAALVRLLVEHTWP